MKVLVPVKRVVDANVKMRVKADGSGLKCVKCRRVYPIRDDIPVMLVDEATIENDSANEPPERA